MNPFIRNSRAGKPIYRDKADQWLPRSGVGVGTESKGASGKDSRKNWGSTENILDLNCGCGYNGTQLSQVLEPSS